MTGSGKLTRRQFNRFSAMAAAAGILGVSRYGGAQSTDRPIGWGIVGLGRISMGHFMPGLKLSKTGRVTALVSGHPEKAAQQAALYNVPNNAIYSYENFDAIRGNDKVDAVYIALPNSMHAEYTLRAAKAGKHVLCEKPMATSIADCQSMIAACRAAGVKLMIAYRCQYEPLNLKAIQLIRSGALGHIQAIESAFGFDIKAGEWRLDRKMAGGGPLMDVGIYCLNACRYLTGEEPHEFRAFSSVTENDSRFIQVEENDSWTMKFPSGILASCNTTYGAGMDGFYRVHGSEGSIDMAPAFNYEGLHLKAALANHQTIDDGDRQHDPMQFTTEADYFADCIRNNREPRSNGEEGLRDIQLISQIYRSAGLPEL